METKMQKGMEEKTEYALLYTRQTIFSYFSKYSR